MMTLLLVSYYILTGKPFEDAIGGHFDMVYKKTMTIACTPKVWNMAMNSKCDVVGKLILSILLIFIIYT